MRIIDLARTAIAMPVLAVPGLTARLVHEDPTPAEASAARILAVRMLAQAVAGAAVATRHRAPRPRSELAVANTVVEALHATTMAGLAAVSPRHRRTALASAGLAALFALAELRDLRDPPPRLRWCAASRAGCRG